MLYWHLFDKCSVMSPSPCWQTKLQVHFPTSVVFPNYVVITFYQLPAAQKHSVHTTREVIIPLKDLNPLSSWPPSWTALFLLRLLLLLLFLEAPGLQVDRTTNTEGSRSCKIKALIWRGCRGHSFRLPWKLKAECTWKKNDVHSLRATIQTDIWYFEIRVQLHIKW